MTKNILSKQDVRIEQGYYHVHCKLDKIYLNDKYIGVKFGGYFLNDEGLQAVFQNIRLLFSSFRLLRRMFLTMSEDDLDDEKRIILDGLNKCYDEIYHDGKTEAEYYEDLMNKAVSDILTEADK